MKNSKRIWTVLAVAVLVISALCIPAFALTEEQVQAQVAASGKGSVAGNVLIWFLCAVAFLKVSQKMDSLLSALGINVGHTGGSMLADAMIATRAITMVAGKGFSGGGRRGAGITPSGSGTADSSGWFLKGGLAGVVSRKITNSAVKTATTQTSAAYTAQTRAQQAAASAAQTAQSNPINHGAQADSSAAQTGIPTGAPPQEGTIVTGGEAPVNAGAMENAPTVGSAPDWTSPQEGVIITGDGASISANSIGDTPFASSMADQTPPQDGMISGESPILTNPIEDTPPIGSMPSGAAFQEGVIVTGSSTSNLTSSVENTASIGAAPSAASPQGGAASAGGAAVQGPAPVGSPPISAEPPTIAASAPDSAPPQDGIILTGNEPAISPAPPTVDPPLGSGPADMTPPQESGPANMTPPMESASVTGGDTTIHAAQGDTTLHTSPTVTSPPSGTVITGGANRSETHVEHSAQTAHTTTSSVKVEQTSRVHMGGTARPTLGGAIFSKSMAAGGSFANDVIGTVARGEVPGSITGDMATQSLQSYLGYTVQGRIPPIFSNAEIGNGRITGYVATPENPQPIAFGMYHAGQYAEPKGDFSKVRSMDGTLWYTQLAQDTVERKPYNAPDNKVAYKECIVKKLPDAPKRKDRI